MELISVVKNIVFLVCSAFFVFAVATVQAEPFYSAKILQADYSTAPNLRLLIRIQDVETGSDEPSGSTRADCMRGSKSAAQPGPTPCFSFELDEGNGNVSVLKQTLLNDPQRGNDPIYIELLYKSEQEKNQYGWFDNKTVKLRVDDNNGLNNWDADLPQSLPQVKIVQESDIYQLVLADADALLNSAYHDKANRLSDEKRTAFREVQRAWMKFRDLECVKSIYGEQSASCMIRLTLDRARQIAVAPPSK
ncbi:lysozyme inhibitor LprI family protein [Pseudomonas mandelii]|nr:lysozyme inhibitor LprI family protein [Pseudomonas mandelii]